MLGCFFVLKVLAVALVAIALANVSAAAVTIDTVYFAQTHVHQTNHPYFQLVGDKDTLIKAHVVDPATPAAPAVIAVLTLGAQTTNLTLTGPAILPAAIPDGLGIVQHAFSNSFTAVIPKAWVKSGLTVSVQAGGVTNLNIPKIGAPTKVIMTMLDVHYFAQASGDYPSGWEAELESKWPVADLELRRLRNVVFPELVIPPRGGAQAARIKSTAEYTTQTGLPFDGEQAAALVWNSALKRAAGDSGRISLYYMSIYGANAGGQASGFAGVGGGTSIGILHHELGHAMSLPHWGDNAAYPYKGAMHGINPPAIYNETHAGPVWAFDPIDQKFIPCTVQPGNVGGKPVGTYKCDPMQGGGTGFQEPGYLMNHFSDYSVNQMRSYLEGHVLIWNTNLGQYASWNSTTKAYTTTVTTNGVNYPTERDVNVISIMASVSGANQSVNMVYPPIGPYLGALIRRFDPSIAADRAAAASTFAPAGGCDVCVRVVQGGVTNTYMLAASWDTAADPFSAGSLQTAAVNLRASDGAVTRIELLLTPDAQVNGLLVNPQVLYTWPGYLGGKAYYWDNNGSTAGFGAASGTWSPTTTGNASQGWSTNTSGTVLPVDVSVSGFDDFNFGNGTNGLSAGTITVSGTVAADALNFASGSGAIAISGGTIQLNSIVAQNTGNSISSAITLNTAGTVSFSRNTSAQGSLTLSGLISGDSDLTFTTPNVNSGNSQQTIFLGSANTYTGDTTITTANGGNTLWVRAGVANALPPTTVLTLNGGNGSGTGRTVAYDLNGHNQTLAGLTSVNGLSLRNQRVLNSSGTAATLTVSNSASFSFGGTIGTLGANMSLTKSGSGTLTLTNANGHLGITTINAGVLTVKHATALGTTAGGTFVNGNTSGNATNSRVELEGEVTVVGEALTINGNGNFYGALNSKSGTNTWAGNITIGSAGTRIGAQTAGSMLIVDGVITSSGAFGFMSRSDPSGTVQLRGVNTYLGDTTNFVGRLQLAGGNDRLPVASKLISGTGANMAEFDLNGFNQELAGIAVNSGATSSTNSINNSSGTLSTLKVNTASGSPSTWAGVLKGNLALTKIGADTLTLTGTNIFTGNTTVSNGTLRINNTTGSGTGTGNVAINGGTLSGTGIISGVVTNNPGGTLAPGSSGIGTLTVGGNLVLKAGSTNIFEVNGSTSTNDAIVLGASVTYGGVLNIVTNGTFTLGQTFILFSGAGATNGSNFASLQGSPGSGKVFSFTNGVLSVVNAGPSGPAMLTNSFSGGVLSLSWPAGQGWKLQAQTNFLNVGLSINWMTVTDNSVSSTNITVDTTKPATFYRLVYP